MFRLSLVLEGVLQKSWRLLPGTLALAPCWNEAPGKPLILLCPHLLLLLTFSRMTVIYLPHYPHLKKPPLMDLLLHSIPPIDLSKSQNDELAKVDDQMDWISEKMENLILVSASNPSCLCACSSFWRPIFCSRSKFLDP